MSNPWDRPPLPAIGDTNPDYTYAGVGHVLSAWEQTEIELGYLLSAFRLKHLDWETMIEYGKGTTFLGRCDKLLSGKDEFFIKVHNQAVEAEFDAIYKATENFAKRRHDIAHAIVRDETWARWRVPNQPDPDSMGRRWFLLPPHYNGRSYNEHALPEYAYTSATLRTLAHGLSMLSLEIQGFSRKIAGIVLG